MRERYDANGVEIEQSQSAVRTLSEFAKALEERGFLTEFDESLWASLVDHMTVYSKNDIRVTFKDGTELTVEC